METQLAKDVHYGIFSHSGQGFSLSFSFNDDKQFRALIKDARAIPEITIKKSGHTNILTGFFHGNVSIIVPDSYAQHYYRKTYADEAERFRDYLLEKRYDIISNFADLIATKWCRRRSIDFFTDEIDNWPCDLDDLDIDYSNMISFKSYGMADLGTLPRCYGLALSVSNVLKQKYSNQVFVDRYSQYSKPIYYRTDFSIGSQCIVSLRGKQCISIGYCNTPLPVKERESELNQW